MAPYIKFSVQNHVTGPAEDHNVIFLWLLGLINSAIQIKTIFVLENQKS